MELAEYYGGRKMIPDISELMAQMRAMKGGAAKQSPEWIKCAKENWKTRAKDCRKFTKMAQQEVAGRPLPQWTKCAKENWKTRGTTCHQFTRAGVAGKARVLRVRKPYVNPKSELSVCPRDENGKAYKIKELKQMLKSLAKRDGLTFLIKDMVGLKKVEICKYIQHYRNLGY